MSSDSEDNGGITITEPWLTSGGTGDEPGDSESTTTGDPDPTTGSGATSEDTTDTADTADTTGDTGSVEGKSCKKVDIVLAIDNSHEIPMAYQALSKLVPHLTTRLGSDFATWDYHLMVIKGDEYWGHTKCEERCELQGNCDGILPEFPCDYEPVACDYVLGAGVRTPVGAGATNAECPIAGGRRYMKKGQPDLKGTLDCLRKPGVGNTHMRRQVQSVFDALSPELNGPGGCNEGFYREDAYLVLVMVTTMADYYTEGGPEEWAENLLSVKGGKFDRIFLVGLFDDGYRFGLCPGDWKSWLLYDWADLIYNSVTGSLCEKDYDGYVDQALDYILADCQE